METALENTLKEPTTDDLRLGVIKRIGLVVTGCVVTSVLGLTLPALYFMAVPSKVSVGTGPQPATTDQLLPFMAFVPLLILLALFVAVAFGIYDAIRVYLRYRKSQKDDQMFP